MKKCPRLHILTWHAAVHSFFHIHNIRGIKKYVSLDSLRTIVHALNYYLST